MNFLEQISLGIEIGNFQSAKLFGHLYLFYLIFSVAQIYEHFLVGERREQGWQGKHQEKEKLTN